MKHFAFSLTFLLCAAAAVQATCPFGYIDIKASSSSSSSSSVNVNVGGGSVITINASSSSSSSSSVSVTVASNCVPAVPCDCPAGQNCTVYHPKQCITTPCPQWDCLAIKCPDGQSYNVTLKKCACPYGYLFDASSKTCAAPNIPPCQNQPCGTGSNCYEVPNACGSCPKFKCCAAGTHYDTAAQDCISDNPCVNNPCPDHAVCSPCYHCALQYQCTCLPGYKPSSNKKSCVAITPCDPNPCPSHSTCSALNNTIAACKCDDGYEPDDTRLNCIPLNPCRHNPCPALATCTAVDSHTAKCTCKKGYRLDSNSNKCVLINPCSPNPCKCGRVCSKKGNLGSYVCLPPVCQQGYIYSAAKCKCIQIKCAFGYHYDNSYKICIPNDFPCASNPCGSKWCRYRPRKCSCSPPTCSLTTTTTTAASTCTANATIIAPWGSVTATSSATANATSTFTSYQCSNPNCKCQQYQCVGSQPSCPSEQTYDNYTGICISSNPISTGGSGCIFCIQSVPRCYPACSSNQYCAVTPQTCDQCASARCVDKAPPPTECVLCSQVYPTCPPCTGNTQCKIHNQTCTTCAYAACE